ncbi:MAG: hypothetical protein HYR96_15425 [Deltaproteobacteria bacterium]|nr:hypothetical protein [Deltaproteobacteria bacterium]MBI3294513.1 hypothetical protein [Deltaproteobacteria bacterium]
MLLSVGILGIVVCSYLLFFYTPKSIIEGTTVIGKIMPKGTIRRRVARSLHWENLTEPATLYLRDIVYATKDSSATIELEAGKKFDLMSDSMIQLDDVSSDSINITLIEGQVKGPDAASVSVKKEVKFRMPAYPTRGVSSLATAPPIDIFELRASEYLARVSDTLKMKSRRLAMRELASMKKTEPLDRLTFFVIELLKPENIRYNLRANHWLEFIWTPIPLENIKSTVELSRNNDFRSKLSALSKGSTLKLQIEEEGTYYWRVKSERGKEVAYSPVGEFHMSLRSGMTQELAVRIPTAKPKGFTIEIATDKTMKRMVKVQVVDKPRCPKHGLAKGSYFCRVKNLETDEVVSESSFDIR